jgi:hypothetical protein
MRLSTKNRYTLLYYSCSSIGFVWYKKFLWAHPNHGHPGSTPPKGSICFWAIILKFGSCFPLHLALMMAAPYLSPLPCPQLQPFPSWFLFFSSLDPSARDYFTTKLWSSPGQHWVANASKQCWKQCNIQYQNNVECQLLTEHKALIRLITPYYTWGQYYIESIFRKIEIFFTFWLY